MRGRNNGSPKARFMIDEDRRAVTVEISIHEDFDGGNVAIGDTINDTINGTINGRINEIIKEPKGCYELSLWVPFYIRIYLQGYNLKFHKAYL